MIKAIILDSFDRIAEGASDAEYREFFKLIESIVINKNVEEHPEAQMTMAILFENGMGVFKDIEKSIYWYTKAANQGLVEAQYLLGELYDNHCYIDEKYQQEAAKWTEKAAKKGHEQAQYKLSYFYNYGRGVCQDSKKAIEWCRKAANQGCVPAQVTIGHEYSYGGSYSKDLSKAAEWYIKAAKQGSTSAQLALAELYECGWGVEQDYPRAYSLFNAAAVNGDDESARLRDKIKEKMSTEQITEAKLLEAIW